MFARVPDRFVKDIVILVINIVRMVKSHGGYIYKERDKIVRVIDKVVVVIDIVIGGGGGDIVMGI